MSEMKVSLVDIPDASKGIDCTVVNRKPLCPNPVAKLPLGTVRPRGWIAHQIQLMVNGQVGRLHELSKFLTDDNGWFGTDNELSLIHI